MTTASSATSEPESGQNPDWRLSSYFYELPENLIARYPSPRRGDSRLYVLRRSRPETEDELSSFSRLPELLPPRSLLVANNARVAPARLQGRREGGGLWEFLLLTPPPLLEQSAAGPDTDGWREARVEGLLRPARKIRLGRPYILGEGLAVTLLERPEGCPAKALLAWRGSLAELLERCGRLPLPPYIRRGAGPESQEDRERYQTVYAAAEKAGALAAPTAGLHFTPALRRALLEAGHEWAELTLFVGYGTFSPVRATDIRRHVMHPEYAALPAESVGRILRAKAEGRPVLAVGTTSARALEAAAETQTGDAALPASWEGWLNTFIYPGRPEHPLRPGPAFRVLDGLITNFHLPESSLLMLVSALSGRERLLRAYARAVAASFRFFSYGDAMLIL